MLYSTYILTEKMHLFVFSPVTDYGREKMVNTLLFHPKTLCAMLFKVQRGKNKQQKGILLKYQY